MAKKRERRRHTICPNCRHEMVCMNKFESIYNLIRGFYVWYICPRRKGETGCGHSVLLEASPKTKRLGRIAASGGFNPLRRNPQGYNPGMNAATGISASGRGSTKDKLRRKSQK